MFVQTRRRKTENPMSTAAGRLPFLLLLGVVLGFWPIPHANSVDVVLAPPFCHNDTNERMVCTYTDATDEVILSAYPNGCDKWKTLELVGAKRLDVTVSCFDQIIVSSSNEVSVATHTGEDKNNPMRSLRICDSNVLSLEGTVGSLHINKSNVASLNVSNVSYLNIVDSSIEYFYSVWNIGYHCSLSNTFIKSLERLELSSGNRFRLTMFNNVEGAIHRISKGGIVVRNRGRLMMSNVSIGSLEKEAIVVTDDARLTFKYCSINEAVVESASLRKEGRLSMMKTSVNGEPLDFYVRGMAKVYPLSLSEQFDGFSTVSMVGSGFLGALMALLVALAVFLMSRRWRPGPCESDRDVKENCDNTGPPEVYYVNQADNGLNVYKEVPFHG